MPDHKTTKVPTGKGSTALMIGSILAFMYLGWLVAQSYGVGVPKSFPQILRAIGEMITIPVLIFVLVAFFLSGSRIARRHRDPKTWVTFALSLLTIASLIVVTVLQ